MSKAKPAAGRRAYSYIRFSTPEQLKGDSLRRQRKLADDWCERNGAVLDDSLKLRDLGISAFKGQNATRGRLGAFVKAIDAGDVPKGAILLVESLDRLSRNEVGEALEQFLGILRRGIDIVTLNPEEWFTKASVNDLVGLITVLVIMSRAYEESKTKSQRISAARDRARELARTNGKKLTRQVPAWIDRDTFEAIPAAKRELQRIFTMRSKGISVRAIEMRLNEQPGPWRPANGWRTSYIKKILGNRTVLGEFQPHKGHVGDRKPEGDPIPDYFPRIIADDLFNAAQKFKQPKGKGGGRTGKRTNVLRGLVKCAYCGGNMQLDHKGQPPKGGLYLVCDTRKRKLRDAKGNLRCTAPAISYDECESLVLDNCPLLKPEAILPDPDEKEQACHELRMRRDGLRGQIVKLEEKINNLNDHLSEALKGSAQAARLNKLIASCEEQQRRATEELAIVERDLAVAEQNQRSLAEWKRTLVQLRHEIKKPENVAMREELNHQLRRFIGQIELFTRGHSATEDNGDGRPACVWVKGKERKTKSGRRFQPAVVVARDYEDLAESIEDRIAETHPGWKPSKEQRAFLRWLTDRRMTRHGRLIRVCFTSGKVFDMVPPASIAGELKGPDLDRLLRQFKKAGKPGLKPVRG